MTTMTLLEYTIQIEAARAELRKFRAASPITTATRDRVLHRLRNAGALLRDTPPRPVPTTPMTRPTPTVDELRAAVARLAGA